MADESTNVLKTALPPATDYLTYLTILEYNLGKDQLPLLHDILQDEKLVVNIGWDLVQLLLPLLPESSDCLEDVAIRGNPREVILKVTEELDRLALPVGAEDDDSEADDGDHDGRGPPPKNTRNDQAFQTLIQMLCILHSRIQTKKPSRFLETSVSAIVSAFRRIASSEDATRASLMFLRAMSGSARPSLPPRGEEVPIPSVPKHSSLPDPEGDDESKAEGEEEAKIRLLRILVSHVIESYLDSAGERDPASPIHWTERFMHRTHSDLLPTYHAETMKALETEDLSVRETLLRQILDLAMIELKMNWQSIKDALLDEETANEDDAHEEQLVISKRGALYLMTALKSRSSTMNKSQDQLDLTFLDHDRIATAILGDPQVSLDTNVPSATADALVRLGWCVADDRGFNFDAEEEKDEGYNMYLQKFSALAATQLSPGLRYHIYLFTNHVLKAHPSSRARWSFLRDTYRFCPFTSLKEVAVIWMKDEYVRVSERFDQQKDTSTDVFAEPSTLCQVLADLYDLEHIDLTSDLLSAEEPFFQACLSLIYLICSSSTLRSRLNVQAAIRDAHVHKYVTQLEDTISESISFATSDGAEDADMLGLGVLQLNVAMAREGLTLIKEEGDRDEKAKTITDHTAQR